MKVFITGGSGYIGNILTKKLSSEFSIISGSQKKIFPQKKNKKIVYKKVNYKSLKSLKKNFVGVNAVIHLVGMNKTDCERNKIKSLVFKEKVTSNILKACEYNNVKKLIYLSSSQIYKNFQTNPIDEKSKIDKVNFYSKGHILAEKKITKGVLNHYTIIRASNIFGYLKFKKTGEQKKNLVHMLCEEAITKNTIRVHNPNVVKNFLPISIFINNIKIVLISKRFDKKIINLGSKSLTLHDLALKIQSRLKIKKNYKKKVEILTNKKIKKLSSSHTFKSLTKKIVYSPKLFNIEIDNILNLLIKKSS
jgi:nucleoside-diphosphate-sugar epimerase